MVECKKASWELIFCIFLLALFFITGCRPQGEVSGNEDAERCCELLPCKQKTCAPMEVPYVPGKLVITYPSLDSSSIEIGDKYKEQIAHEIQALFDSYFQNIGVEVIDFDSRRLKKCHCNRNIFIYDDNDIFGHETGLANHNPPDPGEEGPVVSPNWILEIDDAPPSTYASLKDIPFRVPKPNEECDLTIGLLDTGTAPIFDQYTCENRRDICSNGNGRGFSFITNDTLYYDDNGHGSMVALSLLNGLSKVASIPNIDILPIKVLDSCGRGSIYSVICGLHYAHSSGVDIANLSLGMYRHSPQLDRAVDEVTRNDSMLLVCSAGNRAQPLDEVEHFPSAYARYTPNISASPDFLSFAKKNTFEVGARCVDPLTSSMGSQSQVLWPNTNYVNEMFVEYGTDYQQIVPGESNNCAVSATSYATPQLTAGIAYRLSNSSGSIIIKDFMISNSDTIYDLRTGDSIQYYSYFMKSNGL